MPISWAASDLVNCPRRSWPCVLLSGVVMSVLLGRTDELAILQSSLSRTVRTGESAVVLVRGEPGIGKSTLLKAFAASAADVADGRPVLVGYGQSMTHSLGSDAFQAIRECLRSLVSGAERSSSREMLTRVVRAFRANAPDWLESVPMVGTLLAAGVRTGMTIAENSPVPVNLSSRLDQLTTLVTELFDSGPVVLILDDLHWADSATIDIVMALALKVHGPLLLVLSYRPDDLRASPSGEPHPLTRAVFRLRRYRSSCTEIDLPRLSEDNTRRLILRINTEHVIPDDQVQLMICQSGGIPLYAESLALIRTQPRGTTQETAEPGSAGDLPRKITAVMEERLSFAPLADQRLLEIAVGVGFTFEVAFVAKLARTDLDEIYDRLDCLMREHHLIVEAEPLGDLDRYALYHPMLADVLRRRAEANAPRWRRYHQRLVDILLTQEISDEIAVRAAGAAVTAHDPRAATLASDAAGRQYRAGAVTKARELAAAAMAAASGGPLYVDAAELLALCLSAEANHRQAARVCAKALSALGHGTPPDGVDPAQVRGLTLRRVRSLRMVNDWTTAEDLLRGLEEQLPGTGSPRENACRAEILMLRAETHLCGPRQDTTACIELCDRVIELSQDSALTSRALGHRGLAHLAAYEPPDAERWLHAAIDTARTDGHPYAQYEAVHWLSKKKLACLELDDAAALLDQLTTTSETSGVASDNPFHRRDSSRLHALRGTIGNAATDFVHFFESTPPHAHDRTLTTLACQVHELDGLYGRSTGDELLDAVQASTATGVSSPEGQSLLTQAVHRLRMRPDRWRATSYAIDVLHREPAEVHAAEAIFRFDVPDLTRLRQMLHDASEGQR
jgi:energy-coupling factor transporter ATP-binding protein EcfA2